MPGNYTKYQLVKEGLLRLILENRYSGGAILPSESALAKQFGVSLITVRRALSDLEGENVIHKKKGKGSFVKEIVTKAPQEKKISIIIQSQVDKDSIFALLQGMQTYLVERNYSTEVYYSEMHIEEEHKYLQKFLNSKNDGLICFSVDPEQSYPYFRKMLDSGRHFVLIDRGLEYHAMTNFVSCDNFSGGFQTADFLISLGHTDIAFISVYPHITAEKLRLNGYRNALKNHNINPRPELIISISRAGELPGLIREYGITAIQCVNDTMASAVMGILLENGFHIPKDISIFGFDNSVICKHMPVKLSTVTQPFHEIGATAAQLIDEVIEKNLQTKCQLFLPVELKLRNSHGPKPAALFQSM